MFLIDYLQLVWNNGPTLLDGLIRTLQISLVAIIIATLVGLIGGSALFFGNWFVRALARLYVDVIRGIPLLVLILISFYGTALAGWNVSAFTAGAAGLAVFAGAHLSEIFRGALSSVPHAQSEAAKAIGLRFWQRLSFVVAPQALRRALPPWVNVATEIVKGSTLLSIIGVVDLLLATQQAVSRSFATVELYLTALAIYIAINHALSMLAAALERRYLVRI